MPLINALGYNVFDPLEVVPEFTADVGTKKGEKVDYVIMAAGVPTILIECKTVGSELDLKHASQLFRYFSATEARFAVLTNGVHYKFYTDIEKPNRMDEKPFFQFNLLEMDGRTADELGKFAKGAFDLSTILATASDLKYRGQIETLLRKEMDSPSEDFVRLFCKQVQDGPFTSAVRDQFTPLVRDAFRTFVRELVNQRLQTALEGGQSALDEEKPVTKRADDDGIETTEIEIEGYHIVRAILSELVEPARVVMRDTKSYCGVLLDDNNRKPICRLHFNRNKLYVGIFGDSKNEERLEISSPTDLYKFSGQLKATVSSYL